METVTERDTVRDAWWERCEGCGREYRYPHLCRKHRLCGLCHPPIDGVGP